MASQLPRRDRLPPTAIMPPAVGTSVDSVGAPMACVARQREGTLTAAGAYFASLRQCAAPQGSPIFPRFGDQTCRYRSLRRGWRLMKPLAPEHNCLPANTSGNCQRAVDRALTKLPEEKPPADLDLARVVAAWPALPDNLKTAILAMI